MQKKKGAGKTKWIKQQTVVAVHTHTHSIFYGTEKLAVVAKVYFAYKKIMVILRRE